VRAGMMSEWEAKLESFVARQKEGDDKLLDYEVSLVDFGVPWSFIQSRARD